MIQQQVSTKKKKKENGEKRRNGRKEGEKKRYAHDPDKSSLNPPERYSRKKSKSKRVKE